jgi:hypothetical protein
MCRLTTRIFAALLTFFLGVAVSMVWLFNRQPHSSVPQKKEVANAVQDKAERLPARPKATWEPIFFEAINERAKIAKLASLRNVNLPEGDLEVRVWGGFGLTPLEGFILKRQAAQWSAIHLEGIYPRLPRSQYQKSLEAPRSGWDPCWKRLVVAGLLALPDDSELEGKKLITDGFSYVVEINTDSGYRTYRYSNPAWQDFREAKQMLEIGEIISAEFSLPRLSAKE